VKDFVSVEVLGAAMSQQVIPELVPLVYSSPDHIGVTRDVAAEKEEGPTRAMSAKCV
jgi:hypothetical protein